MKRVLALALLLAATGSPAFAQAPAEQADKTNPPFAWPAFDDAVEAAGTSGKPVLIDVYSPYCSWCRRMQADVYANEEVQDYLFEHFEIGRLNIDDSQTRHSFKGYDITSQELGYGLGAQGTPTTVFLDGNGDYITRLEGYWDLPSFRQVMQYIGSRAYRDTSFEDFVQASTN